MTNAKKNPYENVKKPIRQPLPNQMKRKRSRGKHSQQSNNYYVQPHSEEAA